jgi:hypothetical protein
MTDEVKTTMGMTFKAWNAPNFAVLAMPARNKGDGLSSLPSFPVGELAADALDALASQWLDQLYAKVGRPSPFRHLSACTLTLPRGGYDPYVDLHEDTQHG